MNFSPKPLFLPLIILVATISQSLIAQATPARMVKRSDAIFQQWNLVRTKFGCVDLPWTPIPNPGFNRYEMAAAINTCYNRVSELATKIDPFPVVSTEDLQTLEPLLIEFAAEIATLRGRSVAVSDLATRKIVVLTESGKTTLPIGQFTTGGPRGEAIFSDSGEILTTLPKRVARPIAAWIVPALKELQARYGCPNNQIQTSNPAILSSSRYELAAIINACTEEYHNRGIKLRKIDAADFFGMQQTFAEELVTLQERNREVQRQKCLAQPCE